MQPPVVGASYLCELFFLTTQWHHANLAVTVFCPQWDNFFHQMQPLASSRAYMTAIGNHERDYPHSGDGFGTWDSGDARV